MLKEMEDLEMGREGKPRLKEASDRTCGSGEREAHAAPDFLKIFQ